MTSVKERAELLVAFDTGIRTGEQVALRWGDVHPEVAAYPHGWLAIYKASSRGVVVGTTAVLHDSSQKELFVGARTC